MLKELNVRNSFGIEFGFDGGAHFSIIDVGWHWHPKPAEHSVLTPDDFCSFRAGVFLTLFNLTLRAGTFWREAKEGKLPWE